MLENSKKLSVDVIRLIKDLLWKGEVKQTDIAVAAELPVYYVTWIKQGRVGQDIPWPDGTTGAMRRPAGSKLDALIALGNKHKQGSEHPEGFRAPTEDELKHLEPGTKSVSIDFSLEHWLSEQSAIVAEAVKERKALEYDETEQSKEIAKIMGWSSSPPEIQAPKKKRRGK